MSRWKPMHSPYGDSEQPAPQEDIWIMRDSWDEPQLTWASNIHPAMNAIGLYWTPARDGEGPPKFPSADKEQ